MKKPYVASEYDEYILSTLPYVKEFYGQAISLIRHYGNPEGSLLDLGCGTGMFEKLLRNEFPALSITGIDPSPEMLKEAEKKKIPEAQFRDGVSMDLNEKDTYDVVTAIMVNHFLKTEERRIVTEKILCALRNCGLYISYENVIPNDEFLKEKELDRWQEFQIAAGKPEEKATEHRQRCGVYYYPITVEEHVGLLKETGFRHVYVFWKSYMQMGILGMK